MIVNLTGGSKMVSQTRPNEKFKTRHFVSFLLSSLVFVSACGSKSAEPEDNFAELISLIEIGETRLESGSALLTSALKNFLECASTNDLLIFCEDQRQEIEDTFETVSQLWDFQGLKAELQSVRLTENIEASSARDFFVDHLRAWKTYLDDLRLAAPSRVQLETDSRDWQQAWMDTLQENSISETFDRTCSALGNAQPENSDVFKSRIVDICDD